MAKKVDHDQRKREISERAIHLFSQVGYDNVSLNMIAASLGVSRTVLYRYFCSKREVMDAAITTVTDRIESECTRIILGRERPLEKLRLVCQTVADVMFDNQQFLIAVFDFVVGRVRTGVGMNESIQRFTEGTRTAIRRLIASAIDRGEIPDILVVERIADAIYAEFESCAMRIVLGTERDSSAARVRLSDVIRAISIWK